MYNISRLVLFAYIYVYLDGHILMRYAICEPLLGKDACALGATHGKYQGRDTLLISMDVYDVRDVHKRCNRHAPLRSSLPFRYTQHTFVYGSRCIRSELKVPTARTRA